MNLGNQIHKLRKQNHISQEQLAEKVGVVRQTISKWELGETAPDIKQAQMLSQIFNVSLDELLSNDPKEPVSSGPDSKKKNQAAWKKTIIISAAVVCLCFVIISVLGVVKRSQIMHPQGVEEIVVITRREPIQIGKGTAETIVLSEDHKPAIACELPEGFAADAERLGLYTDESGNFIKFNADYEDKVVNPLFGTDYYSYYKDRGYDTYMEMANAAMFYDLPKYGVLSSVEEIYLAGGAQLIRQQLCAGQHADYYPIDGGLTENGEKTRIDGFALHFENMTWQIMLRDCNGIYYYITIKDPNGVGKSIDKVGELLSTLAVCE